MGHKPYLGFKMTSVRNFTRMENFMLGTIKESCRPKVYKSNSKTSALNCPYAFLFEAIALTSPKPSLRITLFLRRYPSGLLIARFKRGSTIKSII